VDAESTRHAKTYKTYQLHPMAQYLASKITVNVTIEYQQLTGTLPVLT